MRTDYSDFFELGGTNWINTAHQGALPHKAATAAKQAVDWKLHPSELTSDRFACVPARLRRGLANLINAPESEIALANSASYGLHLIANAFDHSTHHRPCRRGFACLARAARRAGHSF